MKRFVIAVTLPLALLALPAAAEEGAWKVGASYVVRSGEIDLATEAGRAAYLAHVERAAKKLCGDVDTKGRRDSCVKETLAGAVEASSPGARSALRQALQLRDQPATEAVALAAQ
ncbi:hypothetical protein sos41_11420 [Alphaproteobacteria bacterium SO-S41]|nr:hypothetical protein sos41_11420 [Alphaproteobacteria bacterium SO-S41]